MLDERIQTQVINKWREPGYGDPETFGDRADVLWNVKESQRLVSLGLIAPELMTFEEQHIWTLIEEHGFFWRGKWVEGTWKYSVSLDSIIRERVDEHWEDLVAIADGEKPIESLPKTIPPKQRDLDDEIPF